MAIPSSTGGTTLEQTDKDGRTPLFHAAVKNDVATIRTLVSQGANVNARDHHGETPLHFAVREFALAAASLLMAEGANPNIQDGQGNTPLFRAVFDSRGRSEMIVLLLSGGADKTIANHYGVSPEKLALSVANDDVIRHLK